jgi:hypothetical protein
MVYLLHFDDDAETSKLSCLLADDYESIQISGSTWLIDSDLDIEELDGRLTGAYGGEEMMLLVELTGDFTMQGLPQEHMDWIDGHAGGS